MLNEAVPSSKTSAYNRTFKLVASAHNHITGALVSSVTSTHEVHVAGVTGASVKYDCPTDVPSKYGTNDNVLLAFSVLAYALNSTLLIGVPSYCVIFIEFESNN